MELTQIFLCPKFGGCNPGGSWKPSFR